MDNEKKYTTTLRLYKERPVHAQAYRCLKNYNTDIFRTKDDFIAEAIVHFSKYLKQEEEKKQIEGWNRYLEQQNGPLLELVKRAVMEVQMEKIPDMIKGIVGKRYKRFLPLPGTIRNLLKKQKKTIHKEIYSLLSFMTLRIKEEADMAVLQKILSFIWTILLLVEKLLCLTVRLVLSLFLLVLQLVLVIFHAGSSI